MRPSGSPLGGIVVIGATLQEGTSAKEKNSLLRQMPDAWSFDRSMVGAPPPKSRAPKGEGT